MDRNNTNILMPVLIPAVLALNLLIPSPAPAQNLGFLPDLGLGEFSMGAGTYQAPNEAISDSGLYSFTRYELDEFEFEIDYGLNGQDFFLGAADYLYNIPTAQGITQTEINLGAGVTFINNDPALDNSKFGMNILGQVRFMDSLSVQIRHDFLGKNANLWTFGLSYTLF